MTFLCDRPFTRVDAVGKGGERYLDVVSGAFTPGGAGAGESELGFDVVFHLCCCGAEPVEDEEKREREVPWV